jgi:hypothetical protein
LLIVEEKKERGGAGVSFISKHAKAAPVLEERRRVACDIGLHSMWDVVLYSHIGLHSVRDDDAFQRE